MNTLDLNERLAKKVLGALYDQGVREICVCPGKRNAPLIAAIAANPSFFRNYYFFEERSAAFFALGRIKNTGQPTAIITTSGTAAGELMPAAMEAHYSGLPLVLVTADRPSIYRGTGAPQTAEQLGLYGVYVSHSLDLEGETPVVALPYLEGPIHLNVCFDEPLISEVISEVTSEVMNEGETFQRYVMEKSEYCEKKGTPEVFPSDCENQFARFTAQSQRPIAIVGSLPREDRELVIDFLLQWGIPVYCEGISGLRTEARLGPSRINLGDRIFQNAIQNGYPVDGVVRIGGVPMLRLWRDLELTDSHFPVMSLSTLKFSGLSRQSEFIQGSLKMIFQVLSPQIPRGIKSFIHLDMDPGIKRYLEHTHQLRSRLNQLLEEEPHSEPGLLAALSSQIPVGSHIFLGNSLPIREWDLAATLENRKFEIWGSRGLNGIDGQISTFLGYASAYADNWGIFGDLTALYDLPAPWILSQLDPIQVNIVVINNGGGKIFSQMFSLPEFQNHHQLSFRSWAELWGLGYEAWSKVPEFSNSIANHSRGRVIEILPDEKATQRFWTKYKQFIE